MRLITAPLILLTFLSFSLSAQTHTGYSPEIRNKVHTHIDGSVKREHIFILDLSDQPLDEIPGTVYELPNLAYLRLANNGLKTLTIPNRAFPALLTLDIRNNPLTELRFEDGSLPILEEVILQYNQLTDLPHFPSLCKVKELDMRYNHIDSIKPNTSLSYLETLYLDENPVKNPEQAFHLSRQIRLISYYGLTRLTVPHIEMPKLKYLILSNTGSLKWNATPDDLPQLRELDVSFTWLDAETLNKITAFKRLTYLNLDHCKLRTLPVEAITDMKRLQTLSIIGNHLEEIPPELFEMKLKKLNYR